MKTLSIIQSNKITNARYDFSALQKNVIYMILKDLQKHMSKDPSVNPELLENFVVSVPVAALAGEKNHSKVIEAAKGLMVRPLQYNYERDNKKYTVATVLVHTAKHEHGSETVELSVPFDALFLLLYMGEGFTLYQLPIALTLKSKHSKRMYELCCRWRNMGGFRVDLQELRLMLSLEKKYKDVNSFRKYVLDVAQKELKHSADVWFDYKMEKIKSRSFNWVNFTIYCNNLKIKNAEKGVYPSIYNYLLLTFPPIINDKAVKVSDRLADLQQLAAAWAKFRPLYEKYASGTMDAKHLMNTTKKILREDFGIK